MIWNNSKDLHGSNATVSITGEGTAVVLVLITISTTSVPIVYLVTKASSVNVAKIYGDGNYASVSGNTVTFNSNGAYAVLFAKTIAKERSSISVVYG